jgi:hypothetical protein
VLSQPIPNDAVAFAFNMYEGVSSFDVQLVACGAFDEESDDWVADEVFSSGENLFALGMDAACAEWPKALSAAKALIARYLAEGTHAPMLKQSRAVAVSFVDGDLDVIWQCA